MSLKPKNKLVIWLPIRLRPTGGTSTFARKFQAGMTRLGHQVSFTRPQQYDLLLAAPSLPLTALAEARLRRIPIIQRLDGVYYPQTTVGWSYWLHNLPLKIVISCAAGVIYQSKYCQQSCDRFLGRREQISQTTIYNGVDLNLFSPLGPKTVMRSNANEQIFITASRFRRLDQIEPLIDSFLIYRKKYHAAARLLIIGDFSGLATTVFNQYRAHPDIVFAGAVSNSSLPGYLRSADAFLFTHLNPPCPNNVIEALACGVPVCGVADGSMSELVIDGTTGKLIPVKGDGFFYPRHFNAGAFADNLAIIMRQHDRYRQRARQEAMRRFSLDDVTAAYERFIKKTLFPSVNTSHD